MRNIDKAKLLVPSDFVPVKKHQTISKELMFKKDYHILAMGLYENTDISPEYYAETKGYIVLEGKLKIGGELIYKNQGIFFPERQLFQIQALEDSIFLEISYCEKEENMENIEKGKVINLKDSLDYVKGAITNLDIVSKKDLKIMILAFDEGEGLKPHSAPGDALLLALEGTAKVGVGENEFMIEAGKQIVFPKDITHSVEAKTKFKMLLILSI
ncbi:cupin domain protein [Clostridiales bacterium KA00134]|nr:cupin domain protein [Clostridiales bacterium KA00134]